jgi:acetyltransferase
MVVIFGTPGLSPIFDVYDLLDEKIKSSKKPIYPVLPSAITAKEEVAEFVSKGRVYFSDEVELGKALARIYYSPPPASDEIVFQPIDLNRIRKVIDEADDGYLHPDMVGQLLDSAGIGRAKEFVVSTEPDLITAVQKVGFPLVMKVVGPVHKSDVGGVVLNVDSMEKVQLEFIRMMKIKDADAVLLQPMLKGTELFAGVKKEDKFGHLILFGLGGIFIEVLKDVRTMLSPVEKENAIAEIKKLKSYKIISGTRGMEGVDESIFAEVICRLGALVYAAPEIAELDLNPLLGSKDYVIAVDARIRIEK